MKRIEVGPEDTIHPPDKYEPPTKVTPYIIKRWRRKAPWKPERDTPPTPLRGQITNDIPKAA